MAWTNWTRPQKIATVLAVVLVASALLAGFGVAETFLASFYTTTGEIHHNATDGPEVIQVKDYNLRSGNPYTDKSYNLSTESNGWVNVSTSDADSSAMVAQIDEINGTWTNASGITATSGNITFQPSDKNLTTVGGGISTIKFRDPKVDDGTTDFIYSATSTATVAVETDAAPGTQYGAVDTSTNEALDVAVADSNGVVAFTDLPTNTETSIEVEELGTLFIREETPDHDQITTATATVKFYEATDDNPQIVERSTASGEIDLTGLPVDREFVVTVQVSNYHNRSIVIENLAQQETIFLLSKTQLSRETVFDVQDESGEFPPGEVTLYVEKAINRSIYSADTVGFQWTTVTGDLLGADGQHNVDLRFEDRYRVRVKNQAGDERILGAYTANNAQTVTLRVETVNVSIVGGPESYGWNATQENVSGTETIKFRFQDPEDETSDLRLRIYEFGNESNEIVDTTSAGPFGTFTSDTALTSQQENTTWIVDWNATRNGEEIGASTVVGAGQRPVAEGLAPWIKHTIAIGSLILTSLLFTGLRAEIGAVVVSALAAVWYFVDFLPPEISGSVIILQFAISGSILFRSQRGF